MRRHRNCSMWLPSPHYLISPDLFVIGCEDLAFGKHRLHSATFGTEVAPMENAAVPLKSGGKSSRANLLLLPAEILSYILNYLDFKSFQRCREGVSWRQYFKQWYHDYGRYISVYSEIRQAWNRIEGYLKENVPMTYEMLNEGLSEEELDEVEKTINYKLPDDMRCSIRIHNGQKDATNSELVMLLGQDVPPKGVFGSGMGYMSGNDQAYYWSELLIPVQLHRSQLQSFVFGLGAIPITMASVSHLISVMVSLDESKNGSKRGQILYMSGDGSYFMDPSASYAVLADSYKEWLCQFSLEMVNGKYPVVNNELFRFYHDPECVEVTRHVKVTVGTMFLPFSHPDHPSFSYYITMSMSESAPLSASCQLETRHWLIKHDFGVDEVNGEAVVGEYPIMRPGAKFSYVSRTNIASPTGHMGGHFVFRNLETDERFQVVCPTFHLRAPRIVTFEERVERIAELKKNQ